jgi:hypothetical protein
MSYMDTGHDLAPKIVENFGGSSKTFAPVEFGDVKAVLFVVNVILSKESCSSLGFDRLRINLAIDWIHKVIGMVNHSRKRFTHYSISHSESNEAATNYIRVYVDWCSAGRDRLLVYYRVTSKCRQVRMSTRPKCRPVKMSTHQNVDLSKCRPSICRPSKCRLLLCRIFY